MIQTKLFLNCQNNDVTYNKKNYLLRAAHRLGIDYVVDLSDRKDDEPTDYILNIEPYGTFQKGNTWSGIWNIDLLLDSDRLSASDYVAADTVFHAISDYPKRLANDKIRLLFQACDPVLHKRVVGVIPEFDFIQAGSGGDGIYNERTRLMTLLRSHHSFFDFGKDRKPEEYVNILSKARVQFIRSMKTDIAKGELAQRFFECLAIGPVLTNYVPDIAHTGLIDGEDFYSYNNDQEMMQLLDLLVRDHKWRDKMAANGRRKALLYHTYEHRLMTILQTIEEVTNA